MKDAQWKRPLTITSDQYARAFQNLPELRRAIDRGLCGHRVQHPETECPRHGWECAPRWIRKPVNCSAW